LATKGLLNKAESARSALEASEALNVATKNLYESTGALLAPIRDVVYRGFAVAFEYIQASMIPAMDDFEQHGKQMADSSQESGLRIAEGFVTGFTAAEIAIFRFEDVMESVSASILLSVNRIANDSVFRFQEMAVQASWLVENIGAITAIVAMGKTTFAEAFQDMPSFGERVVTETEKSLQAILDESVGGLTEDFDTKIRERLEALQDAMKLEIGIDLKPRAGAASALQDQIRSLTAFESRVLVRGQTDGPIDKLVKNTAEASKLLSSIDGTLKSPTEAPKEQFQLQEIR
jgi:hypothetical protein